MNFGLSLEHSLIEVAMVLLGFGGVAFASWVLIRNRI